MTLLKQRRLWASLSALIALILPLFGYNELNTETLTNSIMAIVEGVASLCAIILPLISYFKPKK